ncbi:MAG: glycosyltransferase family 9 protein [Verrucomicrobia bacterium]|nr:glycosyltransferase family 9 protein [Verrucomicrobiota bacterium]
MHFVTYKIGKALARPFLRRSGPIARLLLHRRLLRRPWKSPVVEVVRDVALGDVLMCTPVLREVKRRNPRCRIRFYTKYESLVKGLPYIDEVLPHEQAPPGAVLLRYEHGVPPEVHLSRILGDRIGLNVTDTRPDCVVREDLVEGYKQALAHLPRPRIVFLRRASVWTPNKNWPDSNWVALITSLAPNATMIEIGQKEASTQAIAGLNYVDMRDQTSLEQLVALIAVADLYVGPVSGPMHIAVAVGTSSVTLCGGYESPRGLQHAPGVKSTANVFLSSDLPCAPCWLREPCPIGLKCLTSIAPAQVREAIVGVLGTAGDVQSSSGTGSGRRV